MPTILDTIGAQMCTISYGKESSFAGKLANVTIQVTPMAAGVGPIRLVWATTGDIFSPFTDTTSGDTGAPGIITLPRTDQDGFRHGSTAFKNWYYKAAVTATLADGQQLSRTYQFQTTASTLDLDLLDEDSVVTALPVVVPPVPPARYTTDVTQLPAAGTITGTEIVPVVQGGVTSQATVQQLLALLVAGASSSLDTFFEVATRLGLDETTVTTLQTLVAGKADTTAVAATYSPLLPTTAIKTAAYATAGNEIVPVDATASAVTVTLPNAPADKTRVTVKKIDPGANAVTIATAGSDVLNKAGGSISATLTLLNQASTLQYVHATGVWLVVASDVPLSQLDGRYLTPTGANSTYAPLSAQAIALAAALGIRI